MHTSLITDSLNINLVNHSIQSHKDSLSLLVLIFVHLYVWIAVRKLTQNKKHHLCLRQDWSIFKFVCRKIWKQISGGGTLKNFTLLRCLLGIPFFGGKKIWKIWNCSKRKWIFFLFCELKILYAWSSLEYLILCRGRAGILSKLLQTWKWKI